MTTELPVDVDALRSEIEKTYTEVPPLPGSGVVGDAVGGGGEEVVGGTAPPVVGCGQVLCGRTAR